MTATTLDKVQVDGLTIAYRELGSGPPVLLLHGWPTSSFLWRDVMEPVAEHNRAGILTNLGRFDEALPLREHALSVFEIELEPSDSRRVTARPTSRWASDTTSTCSSARWTASSPRSASTRGSGLRCTISAAPWACIGRCAARSA